MRRLLIAIIIVGAAAGLIYGYTYTTETTVPLNQDKVELPNLEDWPEASQKAAKDMETKYGKPDGVTPDMLIWNNNGIWLKTIVYKKEMKHDFPQPHTDVIEQWINYKTPLDWYDELAQYNGSITANRTNGTLSARCSQEAMNYLALNLAYDILNGTKTVEQARMEYGEHAMMFKNNEKPPHTQSLNFGTDRFAPDPDKPLDAMEGEEITETDVKSIGR